ncbi:hypothetical protein [Halorubrum sp. SD683]|uniref:hypothetical protein n=1 Tax=Halorubrum sp. SD683 TaxID=1855873 RepID=UPI000A2D3C1D|nr:hypothetical protein [Halorubrum sp. SD683]OTF01704.1 hypothetical protein B9G49_00110 [Halorubrum sp. SD683]
MSGGDDREAAPLDADRLDAVHERLAAGDRFVSVDREPSYAPERVVCVYDPRYYPASVEAARLEISWYENGDFSIHYHEDHPDGEFDHRWDRHPSSHNERDHVHPGPDAPTPGDDDAHPDDWRDVLAAVLREVETRQRDFWQ